MHVGIIPGPVDLFKRLRQCRLRSPGRCPSLQQILAGEVVLAQVAAVVDHYVASFRLMKALQSLQRPSLSQGSSLAATQLHRAVRPSVGRDIRPDPGWPGVVGGPAESIADRAVILGPVGYLEQDGVGIYTGRQAVALRVPAIPQVAVAPYLTAVRGAGKEVAICLFTCDIQLIGDVTSQVDTTPRFHEEPDIDQLAWVRPVAAIDQPRRRLLTQHLHGG